MRALTDRGLVAERWQTRVFDTGPRRIHNTRVWVDRPEAVKVIGAAAVWLRQQDDVEDEEPRLRHPDETC